MGSPTTIVAKIVQITEQGVVFVEAAFGFSAKFKPKKLGELQYGDRLDVKVDDDENPLEVRTHEGDSFVWSVHQR